MELQESQVASPAEDRQGKMKAMANHWSGRKHTADAIARMSAARKKIVGWKHSAETKEKIGAAHRGTKRSALARANIATAVKGRRSDKQLTALASLHRANTGAKRSDQARANITAGKIRKWTGATPEARQRHTSAATLASRNARPSSIEIATRLFLDEIGIVYQPEYRIGPYTVDLFVATAKLVVECDGEYWHRNTGDRDAKRDRYMTALGYRVLRLPEQQIRTGAFRDVLKEAVL